MVGGLSWQGRLAAAGAGALGLAIVGMWAAFLAGGWLDDGLATVENDTYAVFHLLAEVGMGLTLLAGAAGFFARTAWGQAVLTAGLGMVVYSTVNSLSHSVRNAPELTPILLGSLAIALVGLLWLGRK